MNDQITEIWIESEETSPVLTGEKYVDNNSDVIVTFKDGKRFVATLFTYENIKTLTEKNRKTGENLNGNYFWASDMILVERIDRENIEQFIRHLLEEKEFERIFSELQD